MQSKRCCVECGELGVTTVPMDYTTTVNYEGKENSVTVNGLEVQQCQNCNEIYLDAASDALIKAQLRKDLGLLSPSEIRIFRKNLGLTQEEVSRDTCIAKETISRWENGHIIQSKSHDKLLRMFYKIATNSRITWSDDWLNDKVATYTYDAQPADVHWPPDSPSGTNKNRSSDEGNTQYALAA